MVNAMRYTEAHKPTTKYWYAIHCNPRKEWQAAQALQTVLGLDVYFPTICHRSRGKVNWEPLFPRYLFVQADLQTTAPSHINTTYGVNRLVMFNDVPQPVPEDIIDAMQEQISRLNAQGGLPRHTFSPGDTVRLKSGPLQGLEAVFLQDSKPDERVRILIEFLGDLRETEVDVAILEHSDGSLAPESQGKQDTRRRRTRGRGRKIRASE
jgi:transcriptional antiterminator RfaH